MKRVSLSEAEKTIAFVWAWHQRATSAIRGKLSDERSQGHHAAHPVFVGMTPDELGEFFAELDYLAMLDLLAAAEAALRVDFWRRVQEKKKDPLSRKFRDLAKQYKKKIALADHILDAWKEHDVETQGPTGDFTRALGLRHWLAHGRYWIPKWGKNYSPADVFDICDELLAKTNLK